MNLAIEGSPNSKPVVHFKQLVIKPSLIKRLDSSPRKALLFRDNYVGDDFSPNAFCRNFAGKQGTPKGLQIQTSANGKDIRAQTSPEKNLGESEGKKLFSLSGVNKNSLERIYISGLKNNDQFLVKSPNP
jgi:hypothetical protein